MAKINPKNHAEAYHHQKDKADFPIPAEGTYIGVNTKLQIWTLESGKKKIQLTTHVLDVVDGGDKSWIGKTFFQDLWMNWESDWNVEQAAMVATACGNIEEFDPDNKSDLVRVMTGVPYLLTIKHELNEWKGQTRKQIRVTERKMIGKDARAKYTNDPDWAKTVGDTASRLIADRGPNDKKDGGKQDSKKQETHVEDDPFASSSASKSSKKGAYEPPF